MGKDIADISVEDWIKALEAENALLKGVRHSAPDSIYAKDLEGRYLAINKSGVDYFQKPISEIIGKTDVELVGDAAGRSIMNHDD